MELVSSVVGSLSHVSVQQWQVSSEQVKESDFFFGKNGEL